MARGLSTGRPRYRRGVVFFAMALVVAACSLYGVSMPLSGRQSDVCVSNLRQIGKAIQAYEKEHGRVPGRISQLYSTGLLKELSTFRCPYSTHSPPDTEISDYILLPVLYRNPSATTIVAVEMYGNHPHGGCVLYRDGRVSFVETGSEDAYRELVKALLWGNRKTILRFVGECDNGEV